MSNKVLVIGGSGFIGSHTADQLSQAGYDVTIFDKNESVWKSKNQRMIIGNYLEYDNLLDAIKQNDNIYHFGGVADISESKENPLNTIHTNIIGITNVLEAMRAFQGKRLMYASTAYVYSDQGSFYKVSKQSAEGIIEEYSKEYGLKYTLIRYGSLYGPRSQSWNGIKKFVKQIIERGKLEYAGNGQEIREYINVIDAAKLSVNLLDNKYVNKALMITGQQVIKSEDLFKMIFEILNKKINIKYANENFRQDHYGNTPYRYSPKTAQKIFPLEFTDLGQGLLSLIEEVQNEIN